MPDPPRPENGTTRSTSATISPNILRYLDRITGQYGVDLQPELARVGLTETLMRSAALRVSYRQGSAVIRRAVELTGDENLGLRVGAAQHLTAWGLLGFAMVAYRVPVFSGFTGYLQTERSQWVKVVVKEVSPREPAYLSKETKILIR